MMFYYFFFDFFEHSRLKYLRGEFKCNYFKKIPYKGIRNVFKSVSSGG